MDWITDRPPTEADGDADGDVKVRQRPGSDNYTYLHWTFVKPGTAWRRTAYRAAPESDAPATAPTPTTSQRPIVGIAEVEGTAIAVADDGTAWYLSADWSRWTQLPALPQREAEELL